MTEEGRLMRGRGRDEKMVSERGERRNIRWIRYIEASYSQIPLRNCSILIVSGSASGASKPSA
jgi:hypothetical protein